MSARLLLVLLLALALTVSAPAKAQNFGNIPPQTVLGNPSTTAKQPAQPMPFPGIDVRQFGVKCDNSTDDQPAAQSAVNYAIGAGKGDILRFPAGDCLFGASLLFRGFNLIVEGAGRDKTVFIPKTNGVIPIQVGSPLDPNPWLTTKVWSTANIVFRDLTINGIGKASTLVKLDPSAQQIRFDHIGFSGDVSGNLIYDQSDEPFYQSDTWYCPSTATWALDWDTWGHSQHLADGLFQGGTGGVGTGCNGLRITQNDYSPTGGDPRATAHRVEGATIDGHTVYIASGPTAVQVGNSLATKVTDSIIDQIAGTGISICCNADIVDIHSNYIGSVPPRTGRVGITLAETTGVGTSITDNVFFNLDYGVATNTPTTTFVTDLRVIGNSFNYIDTQGGYFNSYGVLVLVNNVDNGGNPGGSGASVASVNGTFGIAGTLHHGDVIVCGNFLTHNVPVPYDPSATFKTCGASNFGPPGYWGN